MDTMVMVYLFFVFMLSIFLGFELIAKVPSLRSGGRRLNKRRQLLSGNLRQLVSFSHLMKQSTSLKMSLILCEMKTGFLFLTTSAPFRLKRLRND